MKYTIYNAMKDESSTGFIKQHKTPLTEKAEKRKAKVLERKAESKAVLASKTAGYQLKAANIVEEYDINRKRR